MSYYERNKDYIKLYNRIRYYIIRTDELLEKRNIYFKKYYEKNKILNTKSHEEKKQKRKEYLKKHRETHKEHYRNYNKMYRKINKEYYKNYYYNYNKNSIINIEDNDIILKKNIIIDFNEY